MRYSQYTQHSTHMPILWLTRQNLVASDTQLYHCNGLLEGWNGLLGWTTGMTVQLKKRNYQLTSCCNFCVLITHTVSAVHDGIE